MIDNYLKTKLTESLFQQAKQQSLPQEAQSKFDYGDLLARIDIGLLQTKRAERCGKSIAVKPRLLTHAAKQILFERGLSPEDNFEVFKLLKWAAGDSPDIIPNPFPYEKVSWRMLRSRLSVSYLIALDERIQKELCNDKT